MAQAARHPDTPDDPDDHHLAGPDELFDPVERELGISARGPTRHLRAV